VTELEQAHSNMIHQQVRPSDVLDERVLTAMSSVPRSLFVDPELASLAYADTALPIGEGQTMLSPVLEGRLLQALQIQHDETVLEIGTGSGYFTALLAKLAKQVISVDYFASLSEQAQARLTALAIDNVSLHVGNAAKSWPLTDRIDAIVITAAFVSVPEEYLHSLKVGGRLLAVVGKAPAMTVQLIERVGEWNWRTSALFETVIPPVIHAEPKALFEF
jgi:protein-L-isoaspartate(D-aspartate) O-methyltransferase